MIVTGPTSRRSCRKIGRGIRSSSGFGEGGVPALPVGDDVQEPLGGWHVVGSERPPGRRGPTRHPEGESWN